MPLFGRHPIRLPLVNWNQVAQRPEASQAPSTREMDCPFCGETLRVPARAINTRCTGCQRHLQLEDVVLRGDCVKNRIATCGSILVEPSARFSGILQGTDVVIAGRVMGTVIGTRKVEITATGKVAGTIATRDLKTHEAAVIDGEINILHADNSISTTASHHHA